MFPRAEDPRGKAFVDPEFKIWVCICPICQSEGCAITESAAVASIARPHTPRNSHFKWLLSEDGRWYGDRYAIKAVDEGWMIGVNDGRRYHPYGTPRPSLCAAMLACEEMNASHDAEPLRTDHSSAA